ncbi:hypothetical protein AN191_17215 [Loktanella sp. 5RATIMAR09]|nr:hypothetical protein AN191_17215 [Loktanella sp. 5RATIMAR09]
MRPSHLCDKLFDETGDWLTPSHSKIRAVPTGQDETFIRNIAKAHHWLRQLTSGNAFDGIAVGEGTSKRRVHQMMDLAFLAPDILRDVLDGKQPTGFTSDWCKGHSLPSDWNMQRRLIASL